MKVQYNLPRFQSREEWEALSADNRYWFEQAGKWTHFHPDVPRSTDWAMMNFFHPDNVFKRGQETLTGYAARINSDYRKMYGVIVA